LHDILGVDCTVRGLLPAGTVINITHKVNSYSDTFRLDYDLKNKTVPLPPCRRQGGEEYSFLTSTLDVGEWLASRPGRALSPEKGPPVPIR
jgi:hypothetical protein